MTVAVASWAVDWLHQPPCARCCHPALLKWAVGGQHQQRSRALTAEHWRIFVASYTLCLCVQCINTERGELWNIHHCQWDFTLRMDRSFDSIYIQDEHMSFDMKWWDTYSLWGGHAKHWNGVLSYRCSSVVIGYRSSMWIAWNVFYWALCLLRWSK